MANVFAAQNRCFDLSGQEKGGIVNNFVLEKISKLDSLIIFLARTQNSCRQILLSSHVKVTQDVRDLLFFELFKKKQRAEKAIMLKLWRRFERS